MTAALLDLLPPGSSVDADGVALSGNYAYVATDNGGLQVIDITNPASPQIVGSRDTPDGARGVAVSATYAYVADWDSGLQVIDIANPANPQIVGSVDTPSAANGVAVSEPYAYVADGGLGGRRDLEILWIGQSVADQCRLERHDGPALGQSPGDLRRDDQSVGDRGRDGHTRRVAARLVCRAWLHAGA